MTRKIPQNARLPDLNSVLRLHLAGQIEAAEKGYRALINARAGGALAYGNLAAIWAGQGRLADAMQLLRFAIKLDPKNPGYHNNLGYVLRELGRIEEAEASFREALRINPQFPDALINLGNLAKNRGDLAGAEANYRAAVRAKPDSADAYYNLANTQKALGRFTEAEANYRAALRLRPDYFEVHNNLGNCLKELGHLTEAEASYRAALRLRPGHVETHNNLASVLIEMGRYEEAETCLRNALRLRPDFPEVHCTLGQVLKELGRLSEAEASYREALRLRPKFPEALNSLGHGLRKLNRLLEAEAVYREALALQPDYIDAISNLGNVLKDMGNCAGAEACYRQALQIKPDYRIAHSNLLMVMHYNPENSVEAIWHEHEAWWQRHGAPLERRDMRLRPGAADTTLTVGLLSSSFRRHPALWLSLSALEALNREKVRLIAYSNSVFEDDFTRRLRKVCAEWRVISGRPDEMAVELIRADGLDILIDMSGHSEGRPLICARRVAPIQVKWVGGLFNTSGLDTMDWLIADAIEVPEGDERWYKERIYRMPDGYVVYEPPHYAPSVGPLPAERNGFVTFGSFNNPAKINDRVIALWSELLQQVPSARLVLKGVAFGEEPTCSSFRQRFLTHGVREERLGFSGHSPHRQLLETYNEIDIALDTWPYSGGLTTCEALWMGVPVLTVPGPTFAGRHAASHLNNVGLKEWIAADHAAYLAKAVWWAGERDKLAALRRELRGRVAASPLCDAVKFARHLEDAFAFMVDAHRADTPLSDTGVASD